MRALLSILLLPLTATAAPHPLDPRALVPVHDGGSIATPVVGGSPAAEGEWPDAVAVVSDHTYCTGTLIAPDVVLTAGHCSYDTPTEVVANTLDFEASGGIHASIESITAYPDWENTFDVAVIKLSQPIEGVTPRAVGTSCTYDAFTASRQVTVVGFGATSTTSKDGPSLNKATIPVTDPDCSHGNGCAPGAEPAGEFVAGGNGIDSCYGDSGGPVYLDTPRGAVLVGVVSRGVENSTEICGDGGIYVRTDRIIDWIQQTTGSTIAVDTCANGDNGDGSGSGSGKPGDDEPGDDEGGGCTVGGGSGSGTALLWLGAVIVLRRRRRSQARA